MVHGTLKHLDGTSTVEIFAFIKAVIRYRVDCILYIDQYETRTHVKRLPTGATTVSNHFLCSKSPRKRKKKRTPFLPF